jgi:glutamate 5-kinase
MELKQQMIEMAQGSRDAARALGRLDTAAKNQLLLAMADSIEKSAEKIKAANAKDLEAGQAAGIPMVIADGDRANVLGEVMTGEEVGTVFLPKAGKLESRKRWIAFFQKPAGVLVVDDGARKALCDGGKSLLATGVVRSEGKVSDGDVVSIQDATGAEFARGLIKAMIPRK